MGSLEITNYDVLVEPPQEGRWGDYQLAKHKSHVGNNRLQVFLNLNQSGYSNARQRGDFNACNSIVEKIVSTVCHQCVPRGRFLVSADAGMGNVVWSIMDEENAKALVHKVLQPANSVMETNASVNQNQNNVPAFPAMPMPMPLPPKPVDDGQKRRRRSSMTLLTGYGKTSQIQVTWMNLPCRRSRT